MSYLMLTANQAEVLAQYLATSNANTARISQKEPYGPVYIEVWNSEGKKEAHAA